MVPAARNMTRIAAPWNTHPAQTEIPRVTHAVVVPGIGGAQIC